MQYLLDTNICIYIIKQKPPQVLSKFKATKPGDIAVSSITVAELEYGVHKSAHRIKNKQALEKFLLPLVIANYDYHAAMHYGKIRADLEKKGTPIGALDNLIAAHAMSLGIPVITNNEKEFSRIEGLRVINWAHE